MIVFIDKRVLDESRLLCSFHRGLSGWDWAMLGVGTAFGVGVAVIWMTVFGQ